MAKLVMTQKAVDCKVRTRLSCAANGYGYGKLYSTAPPPGHKASVLSSHIFIRSPSVLIPS